MLFSTVKRSKAQRNSCLEPVYYKMLNLFFTTPNLFLYKDFHLRKCFISGQGVRGVKHVIYPHPQHISHAALYLNCNFCPVAAAKTPTEFIIGFDHSLINTVDKSSLTLTFSCCGGLVLTLVWCGWWCCEIWQSAVYRALQIISCIRPGHSKNRGWLNVMSRILDQSSDSFPTIEPDTQTCNLEYNSLTLNIATHNAKLMCKIFNPLNLVFSPIKVITTKRRI